MDGKMEVVVCSNNNSVDDMKIVAGFVMVLIDVVDEPSTNQER